MRKDILEHESEIRQWVGEGRPKTFICRQLKCKSTTLESYFKKLNIVYKGNIGGKGHKTGKKVDALLASSNIGSHVRKQKLIRDGYKQAICESCGMKMWWVRRDLIHWEYEPIPLELHHKDGDHSNNDLGNLQILCSNCHALTNTNSGKNKHAALV